LTCVTYNYNDTAIASSSKNGEVVLHNAITDLTTRLITTIKLQVSPLVVLKVLLAQCFWNVLQWVT